MNTSPYCFTARRLDERWWLITPDGDRFFSIGLNHVDASPLCYEEAGERWRSRYRNSMRTWLQDAVRPDLLAWGFNTLGWNQEVVLREDLIHRHSPGFTYEEYEWLDLPFAEIHQWENETRLPDFFSSAWEDWCDYVARSQCSRFADHAGIDKADPAHLRVDPVKYRDTMERLRAIPGCVGFHLCGAYLRNKARNRGLRNWDESPDSRAIEAITKVNRNTADRLNRPR